MNKEHNFFGRQEEYKLLETAYKSDRSQLVVIYGRRRVGKSRLMSRFAEDKKNYYKFEGLEKGNTEDQINNFINSLKNQINDPLISKMVFQTWHDVFDYLNAQVINKKQKVILFFDEFQWMALKRSYLVSLIKYYWDNHWSKSKVTLVLCGSIASFMVDKVIKSSALYGRVNIEILLKALKPNDAANFFQNKRSKEEVLKYLMIFGAIPKYLEEINLNQSLRHNINRLCFKVDGFMYKEFNKIFFEQFGEAESYLRIIKLLSDRKVYSLQEIGDKLNIASGGGLSKYLSNLENASMVSSYISFGSKHNSKFRKFRLSDEFLIFYFKFIEPNIGIIESGVSDKLFENLCESQWTSWLGFAFERFCLRNAKHLATTMGFADEVINVGPYFGKSDAKFQIDLLYERVNKTICICEIKYHSEQIDTKIIKELEEKIRNFPLPKGYTIEKALISVHGANQSLIDSGYLHHNLCLEDLL